MYIYRYRGRSLAGSYDNPDTHESTNSTTLTRFIASNASLEGTFHGLIYTLT